MSEGIISEPFKSEDVSAQDRHKASSQTLVSISFRGE